MKKKKRIWVYLLAIMGFVLILTNSCKKANNEDNIQNTPPAETEIILETASNTVGVNGGTVKLSDNAAVIIAPGALSSDSKVTLSKIGNEKIFTAENRNAYDISGLPTGTKIKLNFPCPAGKPLELVGVYNYDPVSYAGTTVSFNYDSINGNLTVDNYNLPKSCQEGVNYSRWIVEWGDSKGDKVKMLLIPMPFYEQIGGSCWAADMTMLTKAYSPYTGRETETEIFNYLKAMDLNMDDGIGIYNFMKVLPGKFNLLSNGAGAHTESYFNTSNLLLNIIKRLDENKPLVLFMPNYGHAVLVVGYRAYLNQNGYNGWELVIHDSKGTNPPSADEGTMYTTRKWSWFLQGASLTSLYMILYADAAVHNDRALQTVSLPSTPSGTDLSFDFYNTAGKKATIGLIWDKDVPLGYKWMTASLLQFDTLPATVKTMNLNLQLYNADLSGNQNVTLKLKVINEKKGIITFTKDYSLTISDTKVPTSFKLALDTADWLKNYGDTTGIDYSIQTQLVTESGIYQDGWSVRFKIKGASILNTQKKYTSLSLKLHYFVIGYEYDPENNLYGHYEMSCGVPWMDNIPCIQNGNTLTGTISPMLPETGGGTFQITLNPDNTVSITVEYQIVDGIETETLNCSVNNVPYSSSTGKSVIFSVEQTYPFMKSFEKHQFSTNGYYYIFELMQGIYDDGTMLTLNY